MNNERFPSQTKLHEEYCVIEGYRFDLTRLEIPALHDFVITDYEKTLIKRQLYAIRIYMKIMKERLSICHEIQPDKNTGAKYGIRANNKLQSK